LTLEERVRILEAKMEEVEKFLIRHRTEKEFEEMKRAFPRLFKK